MGPPGTPLSKSNDKFKRGPSSSLSAQTKGMLDGPILIGSNCALEIQHIRTNSLAAPVGMKPSLSSDSVPSGIGRSPSTSPLKSRPSEGSLQIQKITPPSPEPTAVFSRGHRRQGSEPYKPSVVTVNPKLTMSQEEPIKPVSQLTEEPVVETRGRSSSVSGPSKSAIRVRYSQAATSVKAILTELCRLALSRPHRTWKPQVARRICPLIRQSLE